MATHSSIVALRIPWTEEPGGLQFYGDCRESDTTERLTHIHTNLSIIPGTRVCVCGCVERQKKGEWGEASSLVLSFYSQFLIATCSHQAVWGASGAEAGISRCCPENITAELQGRPTGQEPAEKFPESLFYSGNPELGLPLFL